MKYDNLGRAMRKFNHSNKKGSDMTFMRKGVFIYTALVNDADKLYETGIEHPRYNNGKMIIVEYYKTIKEAKKGHDKWINILTSDNGTCICQIKLKM